MNNSKETVVACWWLSETSELGIKFSPSEDYKADVSSDSSSPERIRILPCLKRPLAGSVAFKFLNVTLLKADVLLRAKVIVSNSEESLLITPADMRRNPATTKQQNKLSRIFRRGSNWNKRPHLWDITPQSCASRQTPYIVYRHCEERLSLSLDTLLVSSINIMWYHSRQHFIWNLLFCTCICSHKLWEEKSRLPWVKRIATTEHVFKMSSSACSYVWESWKHWSPLRGLLRGLLHGLAYIGRPITLRRKHTYTRMLTYLSMCSRWPSAAILLSPFLRTHSVIDLLPKFSYASISKV